VIGLILMAFAAFGEDHPVDDRSAAAREPAS